MQEAPRQKKCPNNQHALKSEPTNQTRPLLLSGESTKENLIKNMQKMKTIWWREERIWFERPHFVIMVPHITLVG
jgi:hypothetical protein